MGILQTLEEYIAGWWLIAWTSWLTMVIYIYIYIYILGGGIPTPLKNMKVKWDDYSQYIEK